MASANGPSWHRHQADLTARTARLARLALHSDLPQTVHAGILVLRRPRRHRSHSGEPGWHSPFRIRMRGDSCRAGRPCVGEAGCFCPTWFGPRDRMRSGRGPILRPLGCGLHVYFASCFFWCWQTKKRVPLYYPCEGKRERERTTQPTPTLLENTSEGETIPWGHQLREDLSDASQVSHRRRRLLAAWSDD